MTSAPTGTQSRLHPLRHVSMSLVADLNSPPIQKIRTEEDVHVWKTTTGYRDYGLFLRRLTEAVVGYSLPWSSQSSSTAVESTVAVLDTLEGWIDDIPPLPTPQRFGNLAFRTWGKRLEDECETLLASMLPPEFHPVVPHLAPYFLTSFGSFTRMDYGTGHETSFALFLLCLTLIRFYQSEPEVERQLVLIVFLRYLRLCWRLQDVYRLEPAGSHGVWGLDDYCFLGYIFGSGQLRDQTELSPSVITRSALPATNLYFLCISRIHEVKQGPFHEHSSQLYSIATGVQHWAKVNSGLFKMYEAEVLGKRVVVQHIPLGGLIAWDPPDSSSMPPPSRTAHGTTASNVPPMTYTSVHPGAGHSFAGSSSVTNASALGTSRLPGMARTYPGPLIPSQLPLGPLANTTLRPRPSGTSSNVRPKAPSSVTPSSGSRE